MTLIKQDQSFRCVIKLDRRFYISVTLQRVVQEFIIIVTINLLNVDNNKTYSQCTSSKIAFN